MSQPTVPPPEPVFQQQTGIINRIASWLLKEVQNLGLGVEHFVNYVIQNFSLADAEQIGLTIGEVLLNLWMNNMMMTPPGEVDENAGFFKRFQGSAVGMTVIQGAANMAGSIPSLGQVNNLGQTFGGIVQNLGMGYMNAQMMFPIAEHSVIAPAKNQVRERAGSQVLEIEQVQQAYKQGLLSDEEMAQQTKELGYQEQYAPVIQEISRTPVDINTLQMMHQNGAVTDEQMAVMLRQGGYKDSDIPLIIQGSKNSKYVALQGDIEGAITQMAAQNKISTDNFRGLLVSLGKTQDEVEQIINTVQSLSSVKGIQQEIDSITSLFRQGQVDEEQVTNTLKSLGLDTEQISKMIQTEIEAVNKANPTAQVVKLDQSLSKGIIDSETYIQKMLDLGYSQETANAKLIDTLTTTNQNGGTKLQNGNLTQTEINLAYAEGHIDIEDFRLLSQQVGTSAEKIDLLASTLSVGKRTSNTPIPLSIIEQGVGLGVITVDQAKLYIQANGYSAQDSTIIADIMHGVQNTTLPGGGGITKTSASGGVSIDELSASRYLSELSSFNLSQPEAITVIALIYNSLIRGGFITSQIAISLLGGIGISESDAAQMVG